MERTTKENLKLAEDQLKLSLETTQEFIDMWTESYQSTLGKLAQVPAFGPVREKQEKIMKSLPLYPKLYTAWIDSNINLQSVLLEATRKTFEKTVEHQMSSSCRKDDKSYIDPERYKEFYKVWIDTYSDTFKEFMRSEHYASDMGRFASVFVDFQKHNREMIEENYLKPNNLPTMTHVDEIHKELYDLRKTVKELTRVVNELSKEAQTDTVDTNDTLPNEAVSEKTKQPKIAESPKVAELPKNTEQSKIAESPKVSELPKKAEQPKITGPPKVSELPKVAEIPKKVEQAKKVEQPISETPKSQKAYPQKKEA
jgi:hypothetical protein